MSDYRKRISKRLRHYKKLKRCDVCQYNQDGLALDFAHIDPREKSYHMYKNGPVGSGMGVLVSRITVYGTQLNRDRWKELKDEIKKCRVVCKNCHVIETYKNREMHEGHSLSKDRKGIMKSPIGTLESFLINMG